MWYNDPSEMTQIACYLYPGTDSSKPKEASMMFWSVLGAVLLLALAAAIYYRKRSGSYVRNSQHGQPWKSDGHPETPGWNQSSVGGGEGLF
jgi:hypothetical protein